MEDRGHELIMVRGSVESDWEAVANDLVSDVQARFSSVEKDVVASTGLGFGYVVVDGLGVHAGDGEAFGCKGYGEIEGWDYVALERVGEEKGVRLSLCVFHMAVDFLWRNRESLSLQSFIQWNALGSISKFMFFWPLTWRKLK